MNTAPRTRLERLKRLEQINYRQCQNATDKATASLMHHKAKQVIRQIAKLERGGN